MAQMRIVKGVPVAPGLALGPVHVVHTTPHVVPTWSVSEEDVPREIARLREAVHLAADDLRRRERVVADEVGERDAAIFSLHRTILQDPATHKDVESMIREQRINAESAVQTLIERFKSLSAKGGDARGYAADFSDPWRVVLDALMRHEREVMEQTDEQVIIAAANFVIFIAIIWKFAFTPISKKVAL